MLKFKWKDGLYLTVVKEETGFHISVINNDNEEVDGYINPFSTFKDAKTACEILSSEIC